MRQGVFYTEFRCPQIAFFIPKVQMGRELLFSWWLPLSP